ncbi:MAG: hypothetical protein WBP84_00240, partial [Nitrososphaeraceae archaeon]
SLHPMPEISQQDIDIMNNLWHGHMILYYTEDTITKVNIDSVESNQVICAVLSCYTRYLSLFILLISLVPILDLPFYEFLNGIT